MFRNGLEPWHIIVLVAIFVALFGYKKLPDAARSVGKSLRIFKTEMKGMIDDDGARDSATNEGESQPSTPSPQVNTSPSPQVNGAQSQPPVAPPPAAAPSANDATPAQEGATPTGQ